MYTYQDLIAVGDNDENRADFVRLAIGEHESTQRFRIGERAGAFYRQIDVELEAYKKKVYDMMGNAYEDVASPNHKLVTNLFYVFIDQAVQYLLGNGISFDDPSIKDELGKDFDYRLMDMLTYASCDGESYGLYTGHGIEAMCYACRVEGREPYFEPLYDEKDGSLKAGIRYWRLAPTKPLRATLYEPDGFTEYEENDDKILVTEDGKQKYNGKYYEYDGGLPIFRMGYINNQSALVGNESKLHTYNMVLSEYANNVDMNFVYWILENCDGMSKQDDINFIADTIKSHVLHVQDGVKVEPHQLQVPYDSKEAFLVRLRDELYTDFMAADNKNARAGSVTTVEINATYELLDRKCDKLEKYVGDAVRQLLTIMGKDPDDYPFHFQRAKERNMLEEIQATVAKAQWYGEDATLKELLEISGKIDEYEEIKEAKQADDLARMGMMAAAQQGGE